MIKERCRLYLITPPKINLESFCEKLDAALDGGNIACVQLRLKNCTDTDILNAARSLLPICRSYSVPLLINDRPDLASISGAEGVHIGQEDVGYECARKTVGSDAIVGVTCHNSRHKAILAAESGADYVAFGAFFPTKTKIAKTKASTDILGWWSDLMVVPCVAIGGITENNCATLVRSGADFLAVISSVWDHAEGPKSGVLALNQIIASTSTIDNQQIPQ